MKAAFIQHTVCVFKTHTEAVLQQNSAVINYDELNMWLDTLYTNKHMKHLFIREFIEQIYIENVWNAIQKIERSGALWTGELVKQDFKDTKQLYHWPWPLNLSCTDALSRAGLSASCWLFARLLSPRGKKSWPSPAGLPFDGLLSTSSFTAALPSGAVLLPLSLLFSLMCSQRYCMFIVQTHSHTYMHRGAHNAMNTPNNSGQQLFTDAHPNWKVDSFVFVQRWKPHMWLFRVCAQNSTY